MIQRRISLQKWMRRNPNDERKIRYAFFRADGRTQVFSSENNIDVPTFIALQASWFLSAKLKNNEWLVSCYEY